MERYGFVRKRTRDGARILPADTAILLDVRFHLRLCREPLRVFAASVRFVRRVEAYSKVGWDVLGAPESRKPLRNSARPDSRFLKLNFQKRELSVNLAGA